MHQLADSYLKWVQHYLLHTMHACPEIKDMTVAELAKAVDKEMDRRGAEEQDTPVCDECGESNESMYRINPLDAHICGNCLMEMYVALVHGTVPTPKVHPKISQNMNEVEK